MNKVRQTPDDVYYSPGASHKAGGGAVADQDEYYSTAPSDNYVRMKSVDQARWSTFDDYNNYDSYYSPGGVSGYYGSAFSPYGYGYGYGFSGISLGLGFFNPYGSWNSYFLWNTCYNPYFYNPYYGSSVVFVNPKFSNTVLSSPHLSSFNAGSYRNANGTVSGGSGRFYRPGGNSRPASYYNSNPSYGNGNRYNNTNTNSYRPSTSSSNSSYSPPARSYTPSAPSGGGGGGGGGGVSRPGRH